MGSEMCIRDRRRAFDRLSERPVAALIDGNQAPDLPCPIEMIIDCLLYTSDAADERSSVDLGGRRIIKKKNRRRDQGELNRATKDELITRPMELRM